ncbi:MAG: hypothetical protein KJ709_02960, partial [Nanoarchaeota archaeon]|nr:hypothetical protein [Nanoarchaeota archaeon]
MHTEEAILIDVFLNNGIMAWFKSGRNLFLKTAFKPTIFIGNTDLEKLRSKLMLYGIRSELTARRTITQQRMPVLAVTADPANVRHLVFELEREYPDARLYNADLHEEQYYLFAEHLFPFCKVKIAHDGEDLKRIELLGESIPELTKTTIQIETSYSYLKDFGCSITRLCMNDQVLEGDERYLMECLQHHLEDEDPDILMVEDSNITLPLLYHRAKLHNIQLKLSRFPQDLSYNQGKSYFSYGRVLYRPRSILLKGRLNIDPSSFLYKESGFSGVAELAILGRMSIQRLAMRSPGAGLSSMQSYAAYKDGILIPYKENLVEKFKS